MACPFCYGPSFATKLNSSVAAFVIALLNASCPSTIPRFIVAVVVNSVYRVRHGWPWSHVRKKIRERRHPSGTYRYTSAAVIGVAVVVWIIAAFFHCQPAVVFLSWRKPGALTVASSAASLAARFVIAGAKASTENDAFASALAEASPHRSPISVVASITNDGQFAVDVPRLVLELVASSRNMLFSHDLIPLRRKGCG